MTPKERAEILYDKYSIPYLQQVLKYYKQTHNKAYWERVANELNKLYKNEKV